MHRFSALLLLSLLLYGCGPAVPYSGQNQSSPSPTPTPTFPVVHPTATPTFVPSATPTQPAPTATPTPTKTPAPATIAIYRLFCSQNGDHLYSSDPNEATGGGYVLEFHAFSLYASPPAQSIALYRCVHVVNGNQLDHFLSSMPNCEGTTVDFLIGYASANSGRPLYRCYNGTNNHHLVTVDPAECTNNGFMVEFVLGYTP